MRLDLNADLGEADSLEQSHDALVMDHITSANVSCGRHAGNLEVMRRTVQLCRDAGVVIGAHPGYADRANFGRVSVPMSREALYDELSDQITALLTVAAEEGAVVRYVKPHGALYHDASADPEIAEVVLSAVAAIDPRLSVLHPPGALFGQLAPSAGLSGHLEGFADRAYLPDGTLVPRTRPDAMVTDVSEMGDRAVRMATDGTVIAVDGTVLELRVESVCLHGDSPSSVRAAGRIASRLRDAGVQLKAFAS